GRRQRVVVGGTTKGGTLEKLEAAKARVKGGHIPEPSKLTVAQYADRWVEAVNSTVATYTHRGYDREVRLDVKPHSGGVKLQELTSLHVQQYYPDLGKAGVSPSMQRKAGVTLGVVLQSAVRLGLLGSNPARGVKKPRVERKEIVVLDPDQLK